MSTQKKRAKITMEQDNSPTTTTPMTQQQQKQTGGSMGAQTCVTLHPLVIINISDHYTRIRVDKDGAHTIVYGALLGKQSGRNLELFNSFEMKHSINAENCIIIDMDYFRQKEKKFREVFPDLDFLGWYTVGRLEHTEDDLIVHRKMTLINESSLLLKLDPQRKPPNNLPITIYESTIETVADQSRVALKEIGYTLASEEAERIGVDHLKRVSGHTEDSSRVSEHMLVDKSAVTMLFERLNTILQYVEAVKGGKLTPDWEILRECMSLCQRLPVLNTDSFKENFLKQCNDVSLITYLAAITKGCSISSEIAEMVQKVYRLNIVQAQRPPTQRRMFSNHHLERTHPR